jgi:hypothetical protein
MIVDLRRVRSTCTTTNTASLLELNANWIAGLNAPASAQRWKLFGVQLCEALYHHFDARE